MISTRRRTTVTVLFFASCALVLLQKTSFAVLAPESENFFQGLAAGLGLGAALVWAPLLWSGLKGLHGARPSRPRSGP